MARLHPGFLIIACLADAASARATFHGLGDLPGGLVQSGARAVSADGLVVVGASTSSNGREAFRWTEAGGMEALGALYAENFDSGGQGVSADGSVVVGNSVTPNGSQAFRWTASEGMIGLGMLTAGYGSDANACSADGNVVVGRSWSQQGFVFRWTPTTGMQPVGQIAPGAQAITARGVSGDGARTVGEGGIGNTNVAYLDGAPVPSAILGDGGALAISRDGQVVVGYRPGGGNSSRAFRWTLLTGMQTLGQLPGEVDSTATACSADGRFVVGGVTLASAPSVQLAFLWDAEHGKELLPTLLSSLGADLTGWTLGAPTGISGDGFVIVGTGTNPEGNQEGWIARFAPACGADTNGDYAVNFLDLNNVLGTYGARIGEVLYIPRVDLNHDGAIDFLDLNMILSYFGQGC